MFKYELGQKCWIDVWRIDFDASGLNKPTNTRIKRWPAIVTARCECRRSSVEDMPQYCNDPTASETAIFYRLVTDNDDPTHSIATYCWEEHMEGRD